MTTTPTNHKNPKFLMPADVPLLFLTSIIDKHPEHKNLLTSVLTDLRDALADYEESLAYLEEKSEMLRSTPIADPTIFTVFKESLEDELDANGCDHSYTHTIKILDDLKITDHKRILAKFQDMGGFCDCEVLYNVLS